MHRSARRPRGRGSHESAAKAPPASGQARVWRISIETRGSMSALPKVLCNLDIMHEPAFASPSLAAFWGVHQPPMELLLSIVTVSLNAAATIEGTLASVALQQA